MDMSGMDMGSSMDMTDGMTMPMNMTMEDGTMMMDMGDCMTAMLWNWNTIDSCFLASSWRIKSSGAFAGSCIGVLFLVIALEMLRRLGKEIDRQIVKYHSETVALGRARRAEDKVETAATVKEISSSASSSGASSSSRERSFGRPTGGVITFRPTMFQQAARATIHMAGFAVAYLLMLIIMSFNGYIFISAMLGAWIGFYMFHWDGFTVSVTHDGIPAPLEEKTLCCG